MSSSNSLMSMVELSNCWPERLLLKVSKVSIVAFAYFRFIFDVS